jgi:hypothetical protein
MPRKSLEESLLISRQSREVSRQRNYKKKLSILTQLKILLLLKTTKTQTAKKKSSKKAHLLNLN